MWHIITYIEDHKFLDVLILFCIITTYAVPTVFTYMDIIIIASIWYKNKKSKNNSQSQNKYIDSLAPSCNNYGILQISLPTEDAQILGETDVPINYMYHNNDNDTITFPESRYGNSKQYYLLNVEFSPRYNQEMTGGNIHTTRTLLGNYKVYSDPINSQTYESNTDAILTLIPTNLSHPFKIELLDMNKHYSDFLKTNFVLTQIEQHRLGLI